MSKGTLMITDIRLLGRSLSFKVNGLGWVDAFNPELKKYNIISNIYKAKYQKVIRHALKKGVLNAENIASIGIVKGGFALWLVMENLTLLH